MAESRDLTGLPSKPNFNLDRDALKNSKFVDKGVGADSKPPAAHSQAKPILPALGPAALKDPATAANPKTASRPNLFSSDLVQQARHMSASAAKKKPSADADRHSKAYWDSE
jgi:hypothetical protein